MSNIWTQFEGRIVENKFSLQKYLAGTEHSSVFLTELPAPQSKKAAIKFVAPDPASAERQLAAWTRTAKLSHPNLLEIFCSGRCRLDRMDLLYVVMQYAEEDLSQVLPERALSESETRDMLGPVLQALAYIHEKGYVHSHLSPANIHAAGDQLKLAADTIIRSGDTRASSRKPDLHDAPETESSALVSFNDLWSLGVTLVEVLTQRPPVLPLDNQSNPTFPETLPQPFLDIARHTLRRDPKRRWTVTEITARLNPAAAAAVAGQTQIPSAGPVATASSASISAAAGASSMVAPVTGAATPVSPLAVPLSKVPAVPAAKLPTPRYQGPSQAVPPRPQAASASPGAPKEAVVLPNYIVPVIAAVIIIGAIFALPKILGRRADSSPASPSATASTTTAPVTQSRPESQSTADAQPKEEPLATGAANLTPEKRAPQATPSTLDSASSEVPAPAALATETAAGATNSRRAASPRGEVLDQVLPEISDKARATIQGRIHVVVRARVDAAGSVSAAELDSPGPSQYFAGAALKAARQWQFTPPENAGRSLPSEWLISFVFTGADTQAFPRQMAP